MLRSDHNASASNACAHDAGTSPFGNARATDDGASNAFASFASAIIVVFPVDGEVPENMLGRPAQKEDNRKNAIQGQRDVRERQTFSGRRHKQAKWQSWNPRMDTKMHVEGLRSVHEVRGHL